MTQNKKMTLKAALQRVAELQLENEQLTQRVSELEAEQQTRRSPRERALASLNPNTPVLESFDLRSEFLLRIKAETQIEPREALRALGVEDFRDFNGTFGDAYKRIVGSEMPS